MWQRKLTKHLRVRKKWTGLWMIKKCVLKVFNFVKKFKFLKICDFFLKIRKIFFFFVFKCKQKEHVHNLNTAKNDRWWSPLGFPRNSQFSAQQLRGFAGKDFFARNSWSFLYQYKPSFARNCAIIRNKLIFCKKFRMNTKFKSEFFLWYLHEYRSFLQYHN